ncbi:hypothetical protein JCM19037_4436 [Geomicrobium sp. JCM 19037]|nr:hypothetical protein JCM19037_4436 [Geomicrobium sp. JCM 19037]
MEPGCEIIVTEVQIQETELLFKTELDTGLFSDDCSMEANPVSFVIEMEKETVHNAEKVQFHGKEADILNGTDPSS